MRNEIKYIDIKESIRKRNTKITNKVNFVAFHKDNNFKMQKIRFRLKRKKRNMNAK